MIIKTTINTQIMPQTSFFLHYNTINLTDIVRFIKNVCKFFNYFLRFLQNSF